MKLNYKRIGDLIVECDDRNVSDKDLELWGVSIDKKFIKSVANIIGTDLSKYKVINKDCFVCSLMQVSRDEKIPIARWNNDYSALVSPAYKVFRITDSKVVLPEYMDLWFKRAEFDREASFYGVGGVRGSLEWIDFCDMRLPIPEIDEQRRIVNAYNTIEHRIELKRKINENLEEQVESLYSNIVSGKQPNNVVSEIAIVETGKRPISTNKGDIPLVGAGGIMDFIDSFNYDSPILTMGRVGTHGIIQRFDDRCWVSDNALVIKTKHYEYVYQFLKKVDYTILNRGSTQPLITQTDVKQLDIYLPSDDELNNFNRFSNAIMAGFSKNNQEMLKLFELQVSIINSIST